METCSYRNLVASLRIDVIELTFTYLNCINLQLLGVNTTVQYIKHQAKLHCFKQNCKLNLQSTLAQSLYIALLMTNATYFVF